MRALLLTATLTALFATGCFNECGFHEQCDGNVLERCGDGPDHIVGRKVRRFPCAGANPVCVAIDESNALCATSAEPNCEPGAPDQCERGVISRCQGGFTVLEDCQRQPGAGICEPTSREGALACR